MSGAPPAPGRLHGRTAVVTGAARGIGAALALRLAREGACIAAVGLEPDNLSATKTRCAHHAPARAWAADVTDHDQMRAVAAEVSAHFGRVDVLVANAGIGLGGLFADSDPAAFDRVIGVNLLGSAATALAFLPALAASRGYYLQVASLAAMVPAPLMTAYCASKAGVESFARALRAEVAHQGVGVGIAYLSWTDTDLVRAADQDELMARFRARLPWPASATGPLDPAVERIAAGIVRRAAHIYAPPWIRALQWLPRGAVPATVTRMGAREVAWLAPELMATAAGRRQPLGPGGLAALAGPDSPLRGSPPPDAAREGPGPAGSRWGK